MATVIKGADAANEIKERIKNLTKTCDLNPCLAVIRVGSDPSDLAYERGLSKTCDTLGIEFRVYEYPADIGKEAFEAAFPDINQDPAVHGILLFRPLPSQLDERRIAEMISPAKDVDCMSPSNFAKLIMGDTSGYAPCTAEAVIRLCEYMKVDFNGARAVVIGRSLVIGKPVGIMLLSKNATVTWCHSKTKDLAAMCKDAEILVSACGSAGLVSEEIARNISPSCVCLDVGVNFKDGKMCGDFDFDAVSNYAAMITPVPGGVGAVTNTVLAAHVVRSAYRSAYGEDIRL